MNTKRLTAIFIALATLVIIGYDIWVAANNIKGDTISEVFLGFAWEHPTLPWVWGIVTGHLTWPKQTEYSKLDRIFLIATMILATGIVAILDIQEIMNRMAPVVPLLGGVVAGHLCWGQNIDEPSK